MVRGVPPGRLALTSASRCVVVQVLLKLLDTADIFITNVRLKSLRKAGLDYETLAPDFPKLIYGPCGAGGTEGGMEGGRREPHSTPLVWLRGPESPCASPCPWGGRSSGACRRCAPPIAAPPRSPRKKHTRNATCQTEDL